MKPRLLVSVSGGATSMYMAYMLFLNYSDVYKMIFVFANTGQETDETLHFMHRCAEALGIEFIWVEAVVNNGRVGTGHNIVNFHTATRSNDWRGKETPFESMIKKYGIPNKSYPHCTRELKERPIHSYVKSVWGKGKKKYLTAIGIRTDESRRAKPNPNYEFIYPLIDMFPTDLWDVNDFWEKNSNLRLNLKPYQGNCRTCWKKSDYKLCTLIDEEPEQFDFNRSMEDKHTEAGAGEGDRVFFRSERSTGMLFDLRDETAEHRSNIEKHKAEMLRYRNLDLFEDDGCSDSCELYS